ncbi:phosphatidylserine decarboxylase family protein [Rhodospirillum rubrum]|uniref:phosphatidylserine decarboxylase n=1 Tax=Rhodospirillum rubrum TaxID=1085 RepID=UPI0019044E51|nr:phosphatidylserine decarboxylase [Rhodospirillum rubrum]MBK1664207.1 phosphatidylserine decarboxylase family protein [Rhodospirillum rubrum]MBK1676433.1 phosphatidylserine decarboxylase family protein [Rhodospirillum rubrum]
MRRFDIGWKTYLLPEIHPEGWRFISIFAAVTLGLWLWEDWLVVPGLVLTIWCVYFFRNPKRTVPDRLGLVVTPASGIVQMVGLVDPPAELALDPPGPRQRISVFMSVFDCHVNRCPVGGTVRKIVYAPGKFVNATLDKASADNERNSVVLDIGQSRDLAFVQIAGLVARRIRCDLVEGQSVLTGEIMGLIRFGSRLDIYLPPGAAPLVAPGQSCISGETVLADLASAEPERLGVLR